MKLSKEHWKFILIKQGCVAVLINFLMNGFMAWVMFKPAEEVTLWEENSFAFDIIATTFFFTFFTSFFVSKASYKVVWEGRLSSIEWPSASKFFERFPPRPFLGSLGVAVLATILIAPTVIGVLILLDMQVMALQTFILFKAFYAGTLAAIVTPIVALVALAEADLIKSMST